VTDIVAIAAGSWHVVALKNDGTLVTWGRNTYGQLGRPLAGSGGPAAVSGLASVTVTAIAAGSQHSVALSSDGTVWSFGSNVDAELGIDTTGGGNPVPVQAIGLVDVVRIGAGSSHSIALTSDLTVWTWGANHSGQLGNGMTSTTPTRVPTAVSGPNMMWQVLTPTLNVATGQYPAIQTVTVTSLDPDAILHYTTNGIEPTESDAVIASGNTVSVPQSLTLKVKGWKPGALPSLTVSATYELKVVTPVVTPVSGAYGSAQTVSIATTTPSVTIRYTTDGTDPGAASTVYSGSFSVAGPLTVRARAYKTNWTTSDGGYATYAITGPAVDAPVITPAAGSYTGPLLVAMTTTTAGATIRYTLDGSVPTASSSPFTMPLLLDTTTTVKAIAFKRGQASSATTTASYALDPAGQVGTPTLAPAGGRFTTQQTVTITGPVGATLHYTLNGVDPTESDPTIASGGTLVVARSLPLQVKAWQAGSTPSAVRRADFLITGALSLASGIAMALKSDRTLWTWGEHASGLGDNEVARNVPGQIATDVVGISAGNAHAMFVKADGSVWVWGSGGAALGTGNPWPERTAIPLSSIANVRAVSAGGTHSLALKADGTVWAWGSNDVGQIGDGSAPTPRLTPVQVVGLSGVRAIAAGMHFSLALADDGAAGGTVWAWGRNAEGQLGDGTDVNRHFPVKVTLPTPIVAIAAGAYHAVALANDGTVWTWGYNPDGRLGDGTITTARVPVQVRSLTGAWAIAAGQLSTHALRTDANIWSWGGAPRAALGLGEGQWTMNAVPVPYQAQRWPQALIVAPGYFTTLFAQLDGSVWGGGSSAGGLLGNGSSAPASVELAAASGLALADNSWLLTDSDADGVPTWRELLTGLDPLRADSDGDGLPDGAELNASQPGAHPDADGDGVPNTIEVARGTDPFNADTDGDAVNDRLDAFPFDATRSTAPPPTPGDTTPPVITLIEPTNAIPIPP
jgi:alpha-tubulin suppressor-like RCC1 family protein